MKKYIVPVTMLALASANAFAADKPVKVKVFKKAPIYTKAPPPIIESEPEYSWTGFYLGASGGYGWARDVHQDIALGSGAFTNPGGPAQIIKPEGPVYGGQVGYNFQQGNIVYGLEIAGHAANIRRTDRSIFLATDSLFAKIDSTITGTGRLGLASGNIMPYLKGGYATAHLTTSNFDGAGDRLTNTEWRSGYTVGGGVEYNLGSNWVAGAEYSFMDFGSKNWSGTTNFANGTTFPERFSDRLTVASAVGRISYKFGGPALTRY